MTVIIHGMILAWTIELICGKSNCFNYTCDHYVQYNLTLVDSNTLYDACPGLVLPYLGMIGRFHSDDPHF